MAGMLGMGQRTFQVANIASAAVWVPVILAPGYFAARGLAQLEELTEGDIITLAAAGGVIVSAALWCGWRILRRRTARRAALMRA
jgi:membrane protein DedA with SNARE-associated domain